jgi:hypothetical protein
VSAPARPLDIEGHAAFAEAALELVAGASREIRLFSYELDVRLYGSEALYEAVKHFLLSSERARLRVLINQSRFAAQRGHRLVELGRLLSSRVEFRELREDRSSELRGEWLIIDERSLLERREPEALVAKLSQDQPLVARERGNAFETLWHESLPARELRSLGL